MDGIVSSVEVNVNVTTYCPRDRLRHGVALCVVNGGGGRLQDNS